MLNVHKIGELLKINSLVSIGVESSYYRNYFRLCDIESTVSAELQKMVEGDETISLDIYRVERGLWCPVIPSNYIPLSNLNLLLVF
jgi:hypothetical protein